MFKSYSKYESIVITGKLIMPNLFVLSKAFSNWAVREIGYPEDTQQEIIKPIFFGEYF